MVEQSDDWLEFESAEEKGRPCYIYTTTNVGWCRFGIRAGGSMVEQGNGWLEFKSAEEKGSMCYIHGSGIVAVVPGNRAYGAHICLVGGAGYVRVIETVETVMQKVRGE